MSFLRACLSLSIPVYTTWMFTPDKASYLTNHLRYLTPCLLLLSLLILPSAFHFTVINRTLTKSGTMFSNIKTHILMIKDKMSNIWNEYLGPILVVILLLAILFLPFGLYARYAWKRNKALYDKIMSIETTAPAPQSNTLNVPDSASVYIINPMGEQDVVIIGEQEKVTVKPSKRSK